MAVSRADGKNYLPLPTQPRLTTLSRKRKEYSQLVDQYFGRGLASLDQQVRPSDSRFSPQPGLTADMASNRNRRAAHEARCTSMELYHYSKGVPIFMSLTRLGADVQALERILYVWAIRHPASGYVQGINDLVCPFFQVFLGAYIGMYPYQRIHGFFAKAGFWTSLTSDTDPELFDVAHLPASALAAIEADSFWCLSKLLDGIQDNYISQQPGIQRLVKRMGELVKRIDGESRLDSFLETGKSVLYAAPLAAHFEDQGVEFMQFAFRWMNCLLMREISVKCTIRMWDTYLVSVRSGRPWSGFIASTVQRTQRMS